VSFCIQADIQGGPRGGAPRGGRGGGPSKGAPADKKKKESILNLANYVDQSVKIKFMGGREGSLGSLSGRPIADV
jgi:U6 snRNA-associated Sm-like protein LSm7